MATRHPAASGKRVGEEAARFWADQEVLHVAGTLERRGFHRTLEEIVVETNRLLAEVLAGTPEMARAREPAEELTTGEARVLELGGADLSPWRPGEMDPRAVTLERYATMLATGLSTEEAAERLGVGEARVRQRVGGERTLYGIKTPRGWRLPLFQFEGAAQVPGMGRVLKELDPELHPVGVLNWFSLPKPELRADGDPGTRLSPREWLLSGGDPEILVPLARDL